MRGKKEDALDYLSVRLQLGFFGLQQEIRLICKLLLHIVQPLPTVLRSVEGSCTQDSGESIVGLYCQYRSHRYWGLSFVHPLCMDSRAPGDGMLPNEADEHALYQD